MKRRLPTFTDRDRQQLELLHRDYRRALWLSRLTALLTVLACGLLILHVVARHWPDESRHHLPQWLHPIIP